MVMENAIEVKELCKSYGEFKLDNISFNIPKGKIMGLIGENGAGKSTTINLLLGLIKKDSGEICYWGEKFDENDISIKEKIGVVLDNCGFYETLTIKKINKIQSMVYKNWNEEYFKKLIEEFKLPMDKEIKNFSKGMGVKLSIAMALAHMPELLILDEPTSGLDPVVRDDILERFLDFVSDGQRSILISSHISSDLEKIADFITYINKGSMVFSLEKDVLINNYGIIEVPKEESLEQYQNDIIKYDEKNDIFRCLINTKNDSKWENSVTELKNVSIDDILVLYGKGKDYEGINL